MTDIDRMLLEEIREIRKEVKEMRQDVTALKLKWSAVAAFTGIVVSTVFKYVTIGK